jgi:chemotaxis protein methyltransferase CheR
VTPLDYEFLCKCLKDRSGLVLSGDKQYLVESRLLPVARRADLASLGELVCALRRGNAEALMTAVVEAMMTNESLFFRDKTPFEHFRDTIMPALVAARRGSRSIRIWCAASSSGQEPYSLAMALKEMAADLADWRIELLATDISNEVLGRARHGLYSQFEVQRGLPIKLLIRYFAQVGEAWQIAPEIRDMVKFRQLNLLADFSHLGTFDLIFCRNVLIYFDQAMKANLLNRLARAVASDGFLVLGAAETVVGLTDRFRVVADKHGLYTPSDNAPGRNAPSLQAPSQPSFKPMPAAPKPFPPRLVVANGGR